MLYVLEILCNIILFGVVLFNFLYLITMIKYDNEDVDDKAYGIFECHKLLFLFPDFLSLVFFRFKI